MVSQKIVEIEKLANVSPVIACEMSSDAFDDAVVVDAKISSTQLAALNTKDGLRFPDWYLKLEKNDKKLLVIDNIDDIDAEEQEKFYEILKYKEISNTALPKNTKIIVIAKNNKKVADIIRQLCLVY